MDSGTNFCPHLPRKVKLLLRFRKDNYEPPDQIKKASVEAVKTVIQQSRSCSKKERLEDLYRRTIGREIASLRDAYR